MEPLAPDVLPLLAPELLVATVLARGRRVSANAAWEAVFGRQGLWDGLQPEDVGFAEEYLAEAAAGSLVTNQLFLVERHGRELAVPVLLNFLPVHLPEAAPGALPVVVTGEVLQEPKSWATEQTKRRRMETLGQMAMGVVHDFNNLLTSILGHVELLRGALAGLPGLSAEVPEQLATVERAATDGATLVHKIQRYIRHDRAERFEPLALATLLEEVASLTRPYWFNEPRRQGISITLRREIEPVPPIRGMEAELREVFVNLILNAVQAMPTGGTLTLRAYSRAGGTVVAEVEDTGTGMPEGVQRRIFEPLFTTKGEAGTGMGLAVSYGIVQEHDGEVEVASEPGQGTRFTLRFPPAPEAPARPRPEAPPPAPEPAPRRIARILVVDDEKMVRSVTAKLLRLKGHTAAEAAGGPEALSCLARQPFDLVVTDLGMPEMSGHELAYRVRQHHPRMPIILLTGHTDAEDLAEHVDVVMRKPFQLDALEATIQRLLNSG